MYKAGKFTGGIPTEWGSLTKLKELRMARCGLDGTFAHDLAYTREIERNLGNQEQGECAWNQKDFDPSETLRPFPFGRLSPHALHFLPLSSLLSVTRRELQKLLPECKHIYV